jgi:asparagine synthase (glutamine-hydrolysing)
MINKHSNNTINPLISALASIENIVSPKFGIITTSKTLLTKDLLSINNSNIKSPIAIGYVFSEDNLKDSQRYQIIDNTLLLCDGKLTFTDLKRKITETETKKKTKQDTINLAKKLIINETGAFVFIITEKNYLLLGRDPLGIQPFYYGQTKTHFVFASNRRTLWNLKIDNPQFFPPGQICIANNSELKFKPVKNFKRTASISLNLKDASQSLLNFLDNSVKDNLKGIDECAIAFSGGLDSSLIAFLAKKYVKNLQLIHVSLSDKLEIKEAKKAAEILNLPIKIFEYNELDVQKTISKVLWIIEESDPVNVSIGIPFYWTAQKTKQMEFEILLAGQGADELFGGYTRYLDLYLSHDEKTANNQMFSDLTNMHENNLARDMKLCNFHSLSLFCPFLSTELVEFALKLPIDLKMEKKPNSLRKLVLRQAGRNLGLPSSIVEKPKKAIQYSTGVNNVLKRLAKKNKKKLSKYIENNFLNQK